MAGALTLAGLLLVRLQSRIAALLARPSAATTARLLTHLPVLTAVLVVLVGAGLVMRALSGSV